VGKDTGNHSHEIYYPVKKLPAFPIPVTVYSLLIFKQK